MTGLPLKSAFACSLVPFVLWIGCSGHHRYLEMGAIGHILEIHKAESRFYEEHGFYATLAQLGPERANSINSHLAAGSVDGYSVEVEVGSFGYSVKARPMVWGRDGRRSFFSDQTGEIHQSWEDRAATITDEILR